MSFKPLYTHSGLFFFVCHKYQFSISSVIALYLTLKLLPVTIFFIIIMTFRINIFRGPMSGYIIFCQKSNLTDRFNRFFVMVYLHQLSQYTKVIEYSLQLTILLTLGAHAQRGFTVVGCVCVCVHVCVCVCLSTSQLTLRWFVCPRNDITHSSDDENQFNCMAYSESAPLLRSGVICVSRQRVRPYPVFVATESFLPARKANDNIILSTTKNTSQ